MQFRPLRNLINDRKTNNLEYGRKKIEERRPIEEDKKQILHRESWGVGNARQTEAEEHERRFRKYEEGRDANQKVNSASQTQA